jgi:hypothetical protein
MVLDLEIEIERKHDVVHASFYRAGDDEPLMVASALTTPEGEIALADLMSKLGCKVQRTKTPVPREQVVDLAAFRAQREARG